MELCGNLASSKSNFCQRDRGLLTTRAAGPDSVFAITLIPTVVLAALVWATSLHAPGRGSTKVIRQLAHLYTSVPFDAATAPRNAVAQCDDDVQHQRINADNGNDENVDVGRQLAKTLTLHTSVCSSIDNSTPSFCTTSFIAFCVPNVYTPNKLLLIAYHTHRIT